MQNSATKDGMPTLWFSFCLLCTISLLSAYFLFAGNDFWGHPPCSVFGSYGDVYADTVKLGFSIPSVYVGFYNSEEYERLPDVIKNYLQSNPYGSEVVKGEYKFTNYFSPPAYLLIAAFVAFMIKTGVPLNVTIFIIGAMCYISLLYIVHKFDHKRNVSFKQLVPLLLLCYPFLNMLHRAHFHSGIIAICVAIYVLSICLHTKPTLIALVSISIAISIRPNAAILLVGVLFFYGMNDSIVFFIKTIILCIIINLTFFYILKSFYPTYSIENFIYGMKSFNELMVKQVSSHSLSSSIYSLIYVLFPKARSEYIYILTIALFGLFIGMSCFISKDKETVPFLLVALYTLFNQITWMYHLLVFVIPIVYLGIKAIKIRSFTDVIIISTSVFMLSFHYIMPNTGPLNAAVLIVAMLVLFFIQLAKSKHAHARQSV